MRKFQQFFALKFSSDRLKKSNFNVDITLDEARKNSELITITNSELIRRLFILKNNEFNQNDLNNLLALRRKIKKQINTEYNRRLVSDITQRIENTLFVEDLINVEFTNKSHYRAILKRKGFYVNGTRFVPFMASAGMIRKNTAMFINNNLKHPLMDILENGRDESTPMAPAKFGAYFSLYSSSTLPVSFPRMAVVPDKEIETLRQVDFVTYKGVDEDDDVTETNKLLKLNAWDGQGLITPRLAKKWSEELELDYTLSCAIVRAPFLKGLVTVFDIELFANEVAGTSGFTDIYGNQQDVRDIDIIVSESMFKLWNSYPSTYVYVDNCLKNQLGFSVAKINPKVEASYSRTSYQFLQVLRLNDVDIANLCEPTISWFRNISGENPESMLLYATGENKLEPKDFSRMDVATKAILLNPALTRDRYVQGRFVKSIEKKKKESHMGSLFINANYQFMVADPYYQACHIFGLTRAPLLKNEEHYSEYWLNRKIKKVGAIRSPIVHQSEFNVLNLKDTQTTRKWFSHIHSGIVYPANGIGIDCAIHGGSDFDGDLICTINNKTMIKGRQAGLPIVYESRKANKIPVDSRNDKEQVESQLLGYNSKVGFATNISSSYYTMLENFTPGSPEHETILKRLKIGRVIQGEIIDGVKGLEVPPFREHWTKYKKIKEDMTPKERKKWEFNNSILCQVRPAFFRFLYPHYMTRYNKELKAFDFFSRIVLGKSFAEVMSNPKTDADKKHIDSYKNSTFFLDNNSVGNKISRYMRANTGLINKYSAKSSKDFDYKVLQDKKIIINPYGVIQMNGYLQQYKSFKRGMWHSPEHSFDNLDAFLAYLRKECISEISSNDSELATYAVEATYGKEISMVDFAWRMFPQGIIQNIMENSEGMIYFPVQDEYGDIEYLWNKYSLKEIDVKELYED